MENCKLKKYKNLKVYKKNAKNSYKMQKAVIKFGDTEIEKQKFHQNKRPIRY